METARDMPDRKVERRDSSLSNLVKGTCLTHGENVYFQLDQVSGNYHCVLCTMDVVEVRTPAWKNDRPPGRGKLTDS